MTTHDERSNGGATPRPVADRLRAIDERLAARMPVGDDDVQPSPFRPVAPPVSAPAPMPVTRGASSAPMIAGEAKYCHGCGAALHASARACPHCGADVRMPTMRGTGQVGRKSRLAAVLLALLLGGIGGHKFYLRRPGKGILYLLFVWTGVPSVLGLIEAVLYALMNDEDFAAKYG